MELYFCFPGGKRKALTLSYDDGVRQDGILLERMKKHGIKCTFNINSGCYPANAKSDSGAASCRYTKSEAASIYSDPLVEVAAHSLTHPHLDRLPPASVAYEMLEDRRILEQQFGVPVIGMAYPYGTYTESVIDALNTCGIKYARTVEANHGFSLPAAWLKWHPTCHHNDAGLSALAESFLGAEPKRDPMVFYLWGHTYEFDNDGNWHVIDNFFNMVADRDDIWYATNGEIYRAYLNFRRLEFSVTGHKVYNPSSAPVWAAAGGESVVMIAPGEYKKI